MELDQPWTMSIPEPTGDLDQGDLQQILHGYSGILWQVLVGIQGKICFSVEMDCPGITVEQIMPSIDAEIIMPTITVDKVECRS